MREPIALVVAFSFAPLVDAEEHDHALQAKYKGTGDSNDYQNFVPVHPISKSPKEAM